MTKNQISINKGGGSGIRSIYSSSDWFNGVDYYTISENENGITIKKCYFEIPKKAIEFNHKAKIFRIYRELPLGNYSFSDESNEDQIVIYYNNH